MFYHQQEIGPVRPLTAPEILARFGSEIGRHEQRATRAAQAAEMREAGRPSARGEQQQHPTAAGRVAGDVIGSALGAAEKAVSGIFFALSDSIAPPPPLTPEQAERQERAEREAQQQAAAQQPDNERRARQSEIIEDEDKKRARFDRHTGEPLDASDRLQRRERGRGRSRSR